MATARKVALITGANKGIGLETVGIEADPHGVPVDAQLRVADRLWAVGDITGIWPLTHVAPLLLVRSDGTNTR